MSEKILKDIENELDDLSIKILQLMNDNIVCKMNIERAVRSGCLDLAKTRYILGNTNSVSTMKIPTENISATTTVVPSTTDEGITVFELNRETPKKTEDNTVKTVNQDPLKWFGILVPTNLRQSQSWFHKAVDHSVQSANISTNLNLSIKRYNKLLTAKKAIKTESESVS